MAKVGTGAAAAALDKDRKTLQRWAKVPGCPLKHRGKVEVEELRVWAQAQGLLERTQESGPRTSAERLLADVDEEPEQPEPESPPPPPQPVTEAPVVTPVEAAPAVVKAKAVVEQLEVSDDARSLLVAIESDDRGALLKEGLGADPKLLKKLEAVGKARAALADAIKRELDNQARRRDLIPSADVHRLWGAQIELVKAHFQSLPGKLAQQIAGRPYEEVYSALERELHELLEAFAVKVPG